MPEIEPFYRDFGRRVRQARERCHLSQAQVGRLLRPPLTRASIANIEAAKQRVYIHTTLALAKILRVTLSDLVGFDGGSESERIEQLESELDAKDLLIDAARSRLKKIETAIDELDEELAGGDGG